MRNDKAHFVAFIGVMTALIFVLFLLEGTVLAGVGMTACVLSLPVAIALCIYDDWKKSFVGGTILGVCSCIFCLIFASVYLFYANPLIAILPRLFIGITAYWTYFGLSKLLKNVKNKFIKFTLPASVAGLIGSITNTILYLLAINIWMGGDALSAIVSVATTIYFPIELVACAVLVPAYVAALKKVNHTMIKKVKINPTVSEGETV